jgi:hypothetical protein
MQDWPLEAINNVCPEDIESYIKHYQAATGDDEKFVLMELLLYALEDLDRQYFVSAWELVKPLIEKDFEIHAYTVWYWACLDEDSEPEEGWAWLVTPFLRDLCLLRDPLAEKMKGIHIPVVADYVLSPQVYYGDKGTSICFATEDEQYGRITFENLDSIKLCRGEHSPYVHQYERYVWVYKVENSLWQKERFGYENKYYGSSYEFGGNVNDMLTDFNHYFFSFHDQFVEAIARGFWFEKASESLFGKPLQDGHPFLELPAEGCEILELSKLSVQVRKNSKPAEQLVIDAQYCTQTIAEFALELEGSATVYHTLTLAYRNSKLVSCLRGYFGKEVFAKGGIATIDEILPYINKYVQEVYERRKAMGK